MEFVQLFFLCCSYLACLLYLSVSLFFFICFFSLLLSWYVFLGVGQRGVVVYHGLVWVRAAVVRPVERAAETPALCAPSRRSVSNHGNHFIYQDQSVSIQLRHEIIKSYHAEKLYLSSTSYETGSQAFAHFAQLSLLKVLQLPNRNVCTVIHSTASTFTLNCKYFWGWKSNTLFSLAR